MRFVKAHERLLSVRKSFFFTTFCILFLFVSCSAYRDSIDEKDLVLVREVMDSRLGIKTPKAIERLKVNISGVSIYKVSDDKTSYVFRYLKNKSFEERKREISALLIASEHNYGPHVYVADANKGVIVMAYLTAEPQPLRGSPLLYKGLADILRKIHYGPSFPKGQIAFDEIKERLEKINKLSSNQKLVSRIKITLDEIQKAVGYFPHSAPCHRDLHPNNLIFMNNQFKAIDFEGSCQDDPFFDLATVGISYCFKKDHEKTFLSLYFARQPTSKEWAKFFLMKQVAFIFFALGTIKDLSVQKIDVDEQDSGKLEPYQGFLKQILEGEINLERPRNKRDFSAILFNEFLKNTKTAEYQNALNELKL